MKAYKSTDSYIFFQEWMGYQRYRMGGEKQGYLHSQSKGQKQKTCC